MSTLQPNSLCALCGCYYRVHVCGDRRLCPDGSSNAFTRRTYAKRASMSFAPNELEWLAGVLTRIEQRADLRGVAGTAECAKVARKVRSMRSGMKETR